jgi:hypothetical protein
LLEERQSAWRSFPSSPRHPIAYCIKDKVISQEFNHTCFLFLSFFGASSECAASLDGAPGS